VPGDVPVSSLEDYRILLEKDSFSSTELIIRLRIRVF
jgi:hypothetical protein